MNQSKFYVEIESVEYPAESSLGTRLLFKKETGKEVNEILGLSESERGGHGVKKDSEGDPKGIYELLGFGMGVVGLGYDDFCRLTIEEFSAICKSWHEAEEERQKGEWEMMRLHAVLTMQPHCKKKLIPANILPFPWDGAKNHQEPELTKEQSKKRLETLMKKQA